MAASASSLAFCFAFSSVMSPSIASRDSAAFAIFTFTSLFNASRSTDGGGGGGGSEHVVSSPLGSSPASLSFPASHGTHALFKTRKFDVHASPSHSVSSPDASSPSTFAEPSAHGTHAFEIECSFNAHNVAAQTVSAPVTSSPASRFVPGGQVTHALETTCSFIAHVPGTQVVSVKTPRLQDVTPEATKPDAHVGLHDSPFWSAMDNGQSPEAPFAGAEGTSHGLGAHFATDTTPPKHEVVPVISYPSPHVGTHVPPCSSVSPQSPSVPFAGAGKGPQASPPHVAAVYFPPSQ
mmetsp:Transcript_11900/g.51033  ORF Transcript_11900/g.51033 Transcript_11900/m.51033 type:complete len:293 (-) Transcript_11900:492-1370(-)